MNKKIIIPIIAAAVLIIGGISYPMVKAGIIKSDPVNHLIYSMVNSQYKAVDSSVEGAFSIDESALSESLNFFTSDSAAMSKYISSILNEMKFSGNVKSKMDLENKYFQVQENISLNYSNEPLLTMGMGYLDEKLFVQLPELYNKPFAISKQEIIDLINENYSINITDVAYDQYIDLLNMKSDSNYKAFIKGLPKYEDVLKEKLKNTENTGKSEILLSNGSSVNCDTLKLSLTAEELNDLYIEIAKVAKDDDALKTLVKSKILGALNIVIDTEDYTKFGVELSEIEKAISTVETDFDESWNSTFDEVIKAYEDMQSQTGLASVGTGSYEITFAIDSKFRMRQIELKFALSGIIISEKMTYNAFDGDVKFDTLLNPEDVVSIKTMMDDPKYAQEIGFEMIDQGFENIINGPALAKLMTDIDEKSVVLPVDERQVITDMVKYFFDNQDSFKDMLLNGMVPGMGL